MNRRYTYILAGIIVLAAAALTGCSDRDRTNPLDPGNPDASRANLGFNALAGSNQVLLEWDRLDFIDLAGVRVQRVEVGTTDTVTVTDTTLALTATRYIDNTSVNGVTYTYHLAFDVAGSNEKPRTIADTVTPGPVFTWVELIDYGEVVLFTPDFRDEVVSLDALFYGVVDIQLGSTVWVLDSDGVISRFQRNGEYLGDEQLGTDVVAFVLDPYSRTSWVALAGENGLIYHFQENGSFISSKASEVRVTSLAVDRLSSDLWIGSTEGAVVKLNTASGNNTSTRYDRSEFVEPSIVVTAPSFPGVWIGDRGSKALFYMTTAGMVWSETGFSSVNDVAVDNNGDFCAVADPDADQVTIYNARNGNLIKKVSGLGNPYYVVFNSETDNFVVSGSSGLITTIDNTGNIVGRIMNPDRTGKMALAY